MRLLSTQVNPAGDCSSWKEPGIRTGGFLGVFLPLLGYFCSFICPRSSPELWEVQGTALALRFSVPAVGGVKNGAEGKRQIQRLSPSSSTQTVPLSQLFCIPAANPARPSSLKPLQLMGLKDLQASPAFPFSPLGCAPGFWRECQPLVWGKLWKQHPVLPNPWD